VHHSLVVGQEDADLLGAEEMQAAVQILSNTGLVSETELLITLRISARPSAVRALLLRGTSARSGSDDSSTGGQRFSRTNLPGRRQDYMIL
jgi:hypothetical protein